MRIPENGRISEQLPRLFLYFLFIHLVIYVSILHCEPYRGTDSPSVANLSRADIEPEKNSQPNRTGNSREARTNSSENRIGPFPIEVEVKKGRVFKKPALTSRVIGFLNEGQKVTVIFREKNWYVIKFMDDIVGWIPHSLFKEPPTAEPEKQEELFEVPDAVSETAGIGELTLAVSKAGLRKKPDPREKLFLSLNGDETFTMMDRSGAWLHVKLDSGRKGWIHQNFVAIPGKKQGRNLESAVINAIGGDLTRKDLETVKIQGDRFFVPETFVLEGKRPRIVCDIFGASLHREIENKIVLSGDFVKKIRIWDYETPEKKVRIVLDLVSGIDYEVKQVFYEKENLYSISLSRK